MCLQRRRPRFNSWVRKICWRRDRLPSPVFLGFLVAQLVKNLSAMWDTWVWSLVWVDPPGEGKVNPLQFWPGEFHGLYSLWGRKELETTERLSLSLFMKSNQILQKLGKLYFTSSEMWGFGFRNKSKTTSQNIIRFGYINKITICKKKK